MITQLNSKCIVWTIILLILSFPQTVAAGGFIHGTRAGSMGCAFTGIADDPSAMAYNPAGLTNVDRTQVYTGSSVIIPSSKYTNLNGQRETTESQVFFPPHLYVSSDFCLDKFAFGLAIYSPFGIGGRKWLDTGLTRYQSVESTIATINVNPSAAWQILPNLSVGAGLNYYYAMNEAVKKVDQSEAGSPDARMEMEATGDGWGYNLGILYKPVKIFSIGAAYRSRVKVDQDGTLKIKGIAPPLQSIFNGSQFKTDVETSITFPDVVNIGIALRPMDKLIIGLEYQWFGWSVLDYMDLHLKNQVPPILTDSSNLLDWQDSYSIAIGFEYWFSKTMAARAGYGFSDTYVPDHTLGPDNPDAKSHNVMMGFGYKAETWTADIGYMCSIYEDRTVRDSSLPGTYENSSHAIMMSAGFMF
ncbi:MAG: hypothetical protein HF978_01445 [Desulfobacteraceae bacterium]|nr:outer membrane protein transport protein [Desulfobacteraceae bacterium]MBC2754194.1 hypothetical protein [Desulfobacteraceae bacterium]